MSKKLSLSVIFLLLVVGLSAQEKRDTIHIEGEMSFQAILQTGNVSQSGGGATAELHVYNSKWFIAPMLNYNYFIDTRVVVQNDLWSHLLLKFNHKKKIFPAAMFYYGYASTFGITDMITPGLGLGSHLYMKSATSYLHVHALVGNSSIGFESNGNINTYGGMSYLKAAAPIYKNKIILYWEFDSFHSFTNDNVHEIQNTVRFGIPLGDVIEISVSNLFIYSSAIDIGKKNFNTTSLFGVTGNF